VPAVVGIAAAFAVANAPAGHLAAQAPALPSATAHLLAATRPAVEGSSARPVTVRDSALPAKYTVKSGDTLSDIARHFYGSTDYWPVLYWANHRQVRYANEIQAGQVLAVPAKPAKIPSPPSALGPAPAPVAATSSTAATSAGTGSSQAAPAQAASTYSGASGSFQACVIARESGGNSQVMNSSGHYGLYQFSSSTWAAYGGNPADFGNASVAEQNQVFSNAIAAGGQSNWAPYDGC
jgi:LysM repeat protein